MAIPASLVALVLVLPSVAVAGQTTDGPSQLSREWRRLTTDSLTVVGNAREGDLRRAGLEMERFRRAVGSLSSSLRLDSPVPTVIVVFRDDNAMTPFKPRSRGRIVDNVAGYFSARPHTNYLVMAPSGRNEFTMRVIFHEYTHYIVSRNFKRIPGWLNEGLADFYSTFSGSDVDGRTIVGRPIDYYVVRLTTQTMMPLAKFITPSAVAELRRDQPGTLLYYAQSWALTHYLLVGNNGARRRQLGQMVNAVNAGVSPEKAFNDAFGPDLAALDRELQAHVRQFQLPAIMLAPDGKTIEAEATRAREVEVLQLQADLLLGVGAYEESDKFLARALALDPRYAPARLTRAMKLLREERVHDALDIASAPDLEGSSDFLAHFVRAEALRAAGQYPAAALAYQRAISLRAELAYAYYGLSMAQQASGSVEAAARSFASCLDISPGPAWYRTRQLEAMRLALDEFVVSDSMNVARLMGPEDGDVTYVLLPAAITQLRTGRKEEALQVLADIERQSAADSWQASIAALLKGTITTDQLIAKAKADTGLLTEAHAYGGILASINGRVEEARLHLEWVKAKGRKDYIEYGFALGELLRLDRQPAAVRPGP